MNELKIHSDSDPEVKNHLKQLREEDQGHPSLFPIFLYGGYKILSVAFLCLCVGLLLWSALVDGYERLLGVIGELRQTVDPPAPGHEEGQGNPGEEQERDAQRNAPRLEGEQRPPENFKNPAAEENEELRRD